MICIFQLPLQSQTVDVVIFCLSLMGKNVADFLLEANRILKTGLVAMLHLFLLFIRL